LIDSGATRHITPYRNNLEAVEDVPPITFSSANRGSFTAMSRGEMLINVPNG
ncbi:hypothetical protein FISHEDRAFT_27573, partial [Fistulina hepatica ATCC 64428]